VSGLPNTSINCPKAILFGHHIDHPPYGMIGVPLPRREFVQPMRRGAAHIGDSKIAKLAAQIEGLVVKTLVDHCAIELYAPEEVEGVDAITGEMNARAVLFEGIGEFGAGKQRPLDNQDSLAAEMRSHVGSLIGFRLSMPEEG
jgi:hypothetical protein